MAANIHILFEMTIFWGELLLWLKDMVPTTRSDISYRGMEDIGTIV